MRQVLGDDDHSLIKTVPRRGYLLDAPLSRSELKATPSAPRTGSSPIPAESVPAEITPRATQCDSDPRRVLSRRPRVLVAAVLLVALLLGSGWLVRSWLSAKVPATLTMMAVPSIAALPVKILGDDTDNGVAVLADDVVRELLSAPSGFRFDIRPSNRSNDALAD